MNKLTTANEQSRMVDFDTAYDQALKTKSPNPLVMTFEQNGIVNPYVRKAGRALLLNQISKRRGGIALIRTICIRSASETPESLLAILTALPAPLQAQFLESRGNDYRALTLPAGTALYKAKILFRNGECWEGEGLASRATVRNPQLHTRLDEMAETRSFNRTTGRGIADGFMRPDQDNGGGDMDYDDEQEFLAEEADVIEGAGPDGLDRFRTSDAGGTGAYADGGADEAEGTGGDRGETGTAEVHRDGVRGDAGVLQQSGTGSPLDMVLRLAADRGVNAEDLAGRPVSDLSTGELRDLYRRIRSM